MGITAGQEKCITTLDRSLVVSAGAGSGKTFTLTKRIAHAFEQNFVDDLDQVLAITYTRKAAAELKSRVKAELRAIGRVDQALKADDAWISTIHGMCTRMLKAHALELGIDPGFAVVEDAQLDALLQRAVDRALEEAQSVGNANVSGLFAHYAVRSDFGLSVEKMVHKLVELANSREGGFDSLCLPTSTEHPFNLMEQAVGIVVPLAIMAERERDSAAKISWINLVSDTAERAHALMDEYARGNLGDISEAEQALKALELLGPMKLNKKFGTATFVGAVSAAQPHYQQLIMQLRLIAAGDDLNALVEVAKRAYELLTQEKHARGLLDNNDLLTLAAHMMEHHPDIAARYADKFKLIMVDEFQDTDQMQVDMIKRLAGPGACRLCTVGDAQQSIYRFRGADVLVYKRHLQAISEADDDAVILLPDNFRSHGDVLAFVDRVFEQPSMFGGSFMSLTESRDPEKVERPFRSKGPRIEVQVTTHPARGGANSDEARIAAARRIAARFAKLVNEEGHAAGDLVILLGNMKKSKPYADALREVGLPCVITGGSVFGSSSEVDLVQALLGVVANPHDTQALYAVLESPLFALSAGDFLTLATKEVPDCEGFGHFKRRPLDTGVTRVAQQLREGTVEGVSEQLACAVRVLSGVRTGANKRTVARLLNQVLSDSGLLARLEREGAVGLASAGNLYKALRIVDQLEHDHPFGPLQLKNAFADTVATAKEAPGALSSEGGDFVRIMTVHSSKGLEFPIVAVAELREGAGNTSKFYARHVEGKLLVSLDAGTQVNDIGPTAKIDAADQRTLYSTLLGDGLDEDDLLAIASRETDALKLRAALCELERIGDDEEAKRLLYVALTRAKEALVVSIVGIMPNTEGSRFSGKGALAGIVSGLEKSGEGFAPGIASYGIQGEMPAVVELVHLPEKGDGERYLAPAEAAEDVQKLFSVPAPEEYVRVSRMPYRPARDGVFSYSSVAEASHEGNLLAQLAQTFCVGVDPASEEALALGGGTNARAYDDVFWSNRWAATQEEDDGSWAYAGASIADEDKATDLGTAFHRLAQYAVETRRSGGTLCMPPIKHVDALARTCKLSAGARTRLDAALNRWFESDIARQMAAFGDLRAEVPFFIALDDGEDGQAFLDGEIDLLALDEGGRHASVVDYKTGGHADETPEQLGEKHVLQASCYALALLRQGIESVETAFVRVEQPRGGEVGGLQCVRYRFSASDMPVLEQAVAEAYRRAYGA